MTQADIQAVAAVCDIINNKKKSPRNKWDHGLADFLMIATPSAFERCLRLLEAYNNISW